MTEGKALKRLPKPTAINLVAGFLAIGIISWIIGPILRMEFLDALDPIVKYFVIGILALAGLAGGARALRDSDDLSSSRKSIRFVGNFLATAAMCYVALLAGKYLIPTMYAYGRATMTYDQYIAEVGKPTVISTKKLGTVTIFPVLRAGDSEALPLLPRDVILPGIAVQTRSGDIATKLAANQGGKVCIKEIGIRRGKGPIYFLDFTQFPNPFYVSTDLSKCDANIDIIDAQSGV